MAQEGTIFLDEIGTISAAAQIKLLQVLQDGTYSRVGGSEQLHTNARIIAATNADLEKMVVSGQFRKDLFYRLNIFPIEMPPLKERIEDLPRLVNLFLAKLNAKYQKKIKGVFPGIRNACRHTIGRGTCENLRMYWKEPLYWKRVISSNRNDSHPCWSAV